MRLVGVQEELYNRGADGGFALGLCSMPPYCSFRMAGLVHKLLERLGLEVHCPSWLQLSSKTTSAIW